MFTIQNFCVSLQLIWLRTTLGECPDRLAGITFQNCAGTGCENPFGQFQGGFCLSLIHI